MDEFSGQVALVTGSMSGMGAAIAARLAAGGATVVLNSRTAPDVPVRFAGAEHDAMHIACDVSDEVAVTSMINEIESNYGRLDILVNCAGTTVSVAHSDLQGVSTDDWYRIFGVNVIGAWNTIKASEHLLRRTKHAVVINISSVSGSRPALGSSVPYAVSKAALNHLTLQMARVLGPEIRVNAIAPGLIDTPWISGPGWDKSRLDIERITPLHRIGEPDDIAEACLGLIRSTYVTGSILVVDGGLSLG